LVIHAYVWMTNHIHLLTTSEYDDSISKVWRATPQTGKAPIGNCFGRLFLATT
jgi:REP element-mobilizing transposase RayT